MGFTILLLGLTGAAVGVGAAVLYRRLTKQPAKQDTSAAAEKPRAQNGDNAAIQKQLLQLQGQLDSGLVTKAEYAAKKQEILKGR